MPTYQEHLTRLFRDLRAVDPKIGGEDEIVYFEIRATMDIVHYVGSEQLPTEEFSVQLTAANMTEKQWVGCFKVDKHPDFLFEVTYDRSDESNRISSYKLIPPKPLRMTRARRHTRFDEEIRSNP